MKNELSTEVLIERLVQRIDSGNTYILKRIGEVIKSIGELKPSQAQQLAKIIKYGGSYSDITRKLAKITDMNVQDIQKIFEEYAKKDYRFAKQFYDYRGIDYIPYEKNKALQNQVKVIAKATMNSYINLSKTTALGFTLKDRQGNTIFKNISDAYKYAIDEAVLSVSQGKDTFDGQMYKLMKQLGGGLKCVDYESGTTRRIDSAIRMNMNDALLNLHNTMQQEFGKEFDSDGVEISVHENPAEDHEDVQGHQFSNEEFDNFQNDRLARDYQGKIFFPEIEGRDRRAISDYNCKHTIFSIILGVSEPSYSNEELKQIKEYNNKGFKFEGKHYTMYQGTQLQRNIETEIRRQKDNQILGRASDNKQLILDSQTRITMLTAKYRKLCKESGLLPYMERMRVTGYKRVKVK